MGSCSLCGAGSVGYADPLGLSSFESVDYSWAVKLAELETILLVEDVRLRAQLYCLACRNRLASTGMANRYGEGEDAPADLSVLNLLDLSVSNLSADLRDFEQTRDCVRLTCSCSTRSVYHLLGSFS